MTQNDTDKFSEPLVRFALSVYLGERCKYCDKEYKTINDLRNVVRADAGPSKVEFRLACQECYDTWKEDNDNNSR